MDPSTLDLRLFSGSCPRRPSRGFDRQIWLLRQPRESDVKLREILNTTSTLPIAKSIPSPSASLHTSVINMFRQQQQGGQFPTMNQPYLNNTIHPPHASQPTYSSPLDQIKQYTGKAEDVLESLMDPIKPYVHTILCSYNGLLIHFEQILAGFGSIFDCCDFSGGCPENHNTVWRSNLLLDYISFTMGCGTHLPHFQRCRIFLWRRSQTNGSGNVIWELYGDCTKTFRDWRGRTISRRCLSSLWIRSHFRHQLLLQVFVPHSPSLTAET